MVSIDVVLLFLLRWTLHWTSVSSQDDGTGEDSQPLYGQGWWKIMLVLFYGTAAWTCWLTMLTVDLHDPDRRSSCLKSLVPFLFLFLSTTLEDLLYVCWSGGLTMINSCLLPPSVETNHMATACFPVSVVSFHNLPWTEQLPKRLSGNEMK